MSVLAIDSLKSSELTTDTAAFFDTLMPQTIGVAENAVLTIVSLLRGDRKLFGQSLLTIFSGFPE